MGIRELWETLTPLCEEKPLYTLAGQTIAIDLACWVVSAKTAIIASGAAQTPGQHLCNVFFRTSQLLALNVHPVFVLEGKAPVLKHNTIAARNQQQRLYNGDEVVPNPKATQDRTRFNAVLKQCADMLRCMGLHCVTAKGEAEAMCAYLNAKNLVDGVISQDSDCFAYGARVVYRNFSISKNSVLVYKIKAHEDGIRFSRNKIVALALFLGCDYAPGGVKGVARNPVLDFLLDYKDSEVIPRIRSWRKNAQFYEEYDMKLRKPHLYPIDQKTRTRMKNEITIRAKALKDPNFPNEEIIREFLEDKDDIDELDIKWRQPNLNAFMKFATERMKWKEIYILEKFLPVITLWQLKNYKIIAENMTNSTLREFKGVFSPKNIVKKQTLKGVLCYQVHWEDTHNYFRGLIPQNQIEEAKDSVWITIENAELLKTAHPMLIQSFEESIVQKKLDKRPPPKKRPKKTRNAPNADTETKAQKIDEFFPKTKVSQLRAEAKQPHDLSFDLNCSGFSDGDDANLSFIVDSIVSRPPKILESVGKMGIKCSIPAPQRDYNDLILESNSEFMQEQNEFNVSDDETNSGDDTIQYDPDELELLNEINQIDPENGESNNCDQQVENELNDTFDLDKPYIPLLERLKKKT